MIAPPNFAEKENLTENLRTLTYEIYLFFYKPEWLITN